MRDALQHILTHGTLARRMMKRLGQSPSRGHLHAVATELRDSLQDGTSWPG